MKEVIQTFWFLYGMVWGNILVRLFMMKWDYWVGGLWEDRQVMYVKKLFHVPFLWGFDKQDKKWRMWEVHLHKMVQADMPECFHSHPARAYRWVVYGGYVEEVWYSSQYGEWRELKRLLPGKYGWVEPQYVHRIDRLLNGRVSYSLWLRGPIVANVELHGEGWRRNGIKP